MNKKLEAPTMKHLTALSLLAALGSAGFLAACGSGSASDGANVTVAGDVPIAYAKRLNTVRMNPTNGAPSAPGGDLMLREKSSPSAPEHNLTAAITQGQGDVSDPEVSYDGKKIVFAMKCPAANTSKIGDLPACTGRWNLWEYDMGSGGLTGGTLRRITASTSDDDVDPAYLPDGRGFVFASNRQAKSHLDQALGRSYYALDEYERERVLNLHTVNAAGGNVQQITFNQSHDRNPVVRANGDIMFSRWEHVADRNRFAVFRAKPDGTDLFVLYGAHSPGNSYLHPREMDPSGPYKGFIASSLMPLSGTQEGGALIFVDAANYSEQDTPANSTVPRAGGGTEATTQALNLNRGLSPYGRVTTPYPLWDGTNRVLVAYRPCEVTRNGSVVPCASLTADELARLTSDERTVEQRRWRRLAGQRARVLCDLHVRPEGPDLAERRRAAARLSVHRPGGDPAARRAERGRSDQCRCRAGAGEHGADRGAQRLRHRRPGSHGQLDDGRGRPRARLHHRHRAGQARRCARHPRDGGRHRPHEEPCRCGLRLCAGAFRAGDPRRAAAGEFHGCARGDRRDQLRAAADPRLCPDRARRFLQAQGAG
jgi:hypothetical protein